MKFLSKRSFGVQDFALIYREEEFSFDTEPVQKGVGLSISVNDLFLELNDKGQIWYVWGLCPIFEYQNTNQFPDKYVNLGVFALFEGSTPGISYSLTGEERWPMYVNKEENFVCIGNPKIGERLPIQFAPGCFIVFDGEEIIAIWLKPKNPISNLR